MYVMHQCLEGASSARPVSPCVEPDYLRRPNIAICKLRVPGTLSHTHSPSPIENYTMAPITDDVVNGLKGLIEKLENRVQEVEAKLTGHESSSTPSTSPSGMRMVIMGPPGAGQTILSNIVFLKLTTAKEREHKHQQSRKDSASATW